LAANLLAAPLGEIVALPLCLVHALLGPWPSIERAVALAASGALAIIREIARLGAAIDWLYLELPVPGPWHLATLVLGLAGFVALRSVRWLGSARRAAPTGVAPAWLSSAWLAPAWLSSAWLGLAALALVLVEWRTQRVHSAAWHRERHLLVVTALDVGQGDATLIDLPDGRLALIDGGGLPGSTLDIGARVLLPVLRARRRSHLDLVVLTHPHPDHFGGLLSLLEQVSVGEFWYPGAHGSPAEATSPVAEMVRRLRARGVRVRTAPELCGEQNLVPPGAGYGIDVLGPCPSIEPGASENDNSLVLRVRAGERSALFLGDAERSAERRLLDGGRALGADFLKVGHHGSRSSSTPEFIARVQPTVASISAGLGNRFGHPHPETLATLAAAGALTLRIDELGSVVWQSDGRQQSIRTFLPAARGSGGALPAAAAARGG
jgi:competence protein ComEC